MADRARSVTEVIAGEAAAGTREQRLADMVAIASVIQNRARALGVTPEQVVQNHREFNAYGKPLPAGTRPLTGLAQEALNYVEVNGPVHNATFYATPKAMGNLPRGLSEAHRTTGHVYFTDPQGRAINTAVGTKRFDASALAQSVSAGLRNPLGARDIAPPGIGPHSSVPPTPTFASPTARAIELARGTVPTSTLSPIQMAAGRSIGGLIPSATSAGVSPSAGRAIGPIGTGGMASAPVQLAGRTIAPAQVGQSLAPLGSFARSAPVGPTRSIAPAQGASRASQPVARVASPVSTTTRLAGQDVTGGLAERGPRVTSRPVAGGKSILSAGGEANLAGRLGAPTPARTPSSAPMAIAASFAGGTKPAAPTRAPPAQMGSFAPASTPRLSPVASKPAVASPVDRQARTVAPAAVATPTLAPVTTRPATLSPVTTTLTAAPVATIAKAAPVVTTETAKPVAVQSIRVAPLSPTMMGPPAPKPVADPAPVAALPPPRVVAAPPPVRPPAPVARVVAPVVRAPMPVQRVSAAIKMAPGRSIGGLSVPAGWTPAPAARGYATINGNGGVSYTGANGAPISDPWSGLRIVTGSGGRGNGIGPGGSGPAAPSQSAPNNNTSKRR